MLIKTQSQSLTEQLADLFAQRIRTRLLAQGARLPSVRQCAQLHGVNPSTVVAAYDRLVGLGLVEARRNRGFFVREDAAVRTSAAQAQAMLGAGKADGASKSSASRGSPQFDPDNGNGVGKVEGESRLLPINATALIRAMFQNVSDKPQPGMGALPAQWLETSFLNTAVRKVSSASALHAHSLQYGDPLGDAMLRDALAKRLGSLGVPAEPDQIITTVGATHALDVVSRTLLRAGDWVMVEEPGWAVEFARLQALGMRILPVPRGPDGPDLAVMARYCEMHSPKLYVSVSVLHNPTGYCLSSASAHRVLQLANAHQFHIVEDDTYSHIADEHATRLCAMDGLQRTIYVSGFAKILAPNWRVGYLAAPPSLVSALLDTKLLTTLTTPSLLERALAHCMVQGQLRRHSLRVRALLDAARTRSVKLATQAGCVFAAEPAGLFGWVDTGVDTDALSQRMLDHGYLLAPGALFHAQRKPSTLMRINFGTTQDAAFWRVFTRLLGGKGR